MQKPTLQTILISILIIVALFSSIYLPYKWKQLSNDFLDQTNQYGELLKQINDLQKEVRKLNNEKKKAEELEELPNENLETEEKDEPEEISDWKTYRDNEYEFKFKYSKSFNIVKASETTSLAGYHERYLFFHPTRPYLSFSALSENLARDMDKRLGGQINEFGSDGVYYDSRFIGYRQWEEEKKIFDQLKIGNDCTHLSPGLQLCKIISINNKKFLVNYFFDPAGYHYEKYYITYHQGLRFTFSSNVSPDDLAEITGQDFRSDYCNPIKSKRYCGEGVDQYICFEIDTEILDKCEKNIMAKENGVDNLHLFNLIASSFKFIE